MVPPLPSVGLVTEPEMAANRHRARALCLAAGIVPGLVVGIILLALLGPIEGLVALVVVTAAVAVGVWRGSTALALRAVGARRPSNVEEPRLTNLILGLCATMGLNEPDLMVLDDPVPNACAFGRDQADAVIIVTTGLLESLELVELEAVIAHELAHVKRRDTALAGVAVAVLGPVCRMTGNDQLLHRAVGPGREYRADQIGMSAVRYPPGLQAALEQLVVEPGPGAQSLFGGQRFAGTRWVWIDPMVGRRGESPVGDLDDTSVRIEALHQW